MNKYMWLNKLLILNNQLNFKIGNKSLIIDVSVDDT